MKNTRIGYARCSTDKQDLAAQRAALAELDVASDRIYADHGLTGRNRQRPGLDQALAAMRTFRSFYRQFLARPTNPIFSPVANTHDEHNTVPFNVINDHVLLVWMHPHRRV